ncbi:hypothetical protein LK537_25360 [Lachnoclostridium pacaense]|uniref:BppU family phage baseplate upper protein n=1 Tax=Enterocloster hominis (ex Hitch et al. 2024) TaxID=1917870 RepID=UPI001D12BA51|nr:hypothetical protein [Lachnoclostridium pacaense]MCC2820640.1 hypothetical protein [Lachnoclostridium pacaense]
MTTYMVVLNIKQEKAIETGISVSQGDYGQIEFVIRVKDDDDYILDAQSAIITFNTPNGEVVKGNLAGTQGTYHYTIQGNELLSPGKIVATVTLIYENGRKSSCSFNFYNRYNPLYDRGTPARSYVPEIEKIKKDGEEAVKYIENLIATGDFKGEPGNDGMDGADGKDAYTIAVDEGFVGTREEWLNSLKGETGKGIAILGSYGSYESLIESHPNGNTGDNYLINGNLYVWSDNENKWVDAGKIQGPPGESVASGVSAIDTQGVAVRKASGTGHVTITDAAEHPLLNLNLAGKSEQAVTTGAQLFDANSLSSNNATATISESGRIIRAVGKNTSASNLYAVIDISQVAGKTVYLQGDQVSKSNGTIQMQLRVKGTDGTYRYATSADSVGSNIKLSLDIHLDDTELMLFLYCRSISDTDNVAVFENIRVGIAESAWEPYTGGKPSPSPEYPQPIKGTGTVSTGANLLPYPYAVAVDTLVNNGITFTSLEDGRVSIKGTVTGTNATFILQKKLILPPGNYKKNNTGSIKFMISRYLNGAFDRAEVSRDEVTFDTHDWDYDVYEYKPLLQTVTVGDTFENLIVSPMLSAGDTPKPWEPYTGGKPSPSPEYPQPLDVTVTGAQMLDARKVLNKSLGGATIVNNADGSITISGSGAMTATLDTRCTLTHKETMALIGNERTFTITANVGTYPYFFFNFIDKTGAVFRAELTNNVTCITKSIPTTADINTLYVQFGYYGRIDSSIAAGNQKVMVNAGSTALPWQPYESCTAAITLTEPLHGIGDVRDRIMCKDGIWGIERNRKIAIYDGVINRATVANEAWDTQYPGFVHCNLTRMADWLVGQVDFMSDAFPCTTEINRNFRNTELSCHTSNDGIYLFISHELVGITDDDDSATRIAKVNAWIQSHNFKVEYSTTTPAWEPFPSDTQSALNALTTYTGTTHVTITAGGPEPDVGLEYFGQPGDKVTVQDMCDSFAAPGFDDSGDVQGISGFGDFLNRMTSGMRLPSFFRDLKAGLKFVLHTGQLVNNGLCNEPGKYPLDAAYGRTLLEMIGNTANLPGGAADIVSAIVTQNSNLGNLQGLCNDLDTLWSQDYVSCVAIKRFSGGTLNTPHKQDAALTAGREDGFVISLFLEAWGVQVAAYVGDAGNCLYRRGLDNGTKSIWSTI